MGEGGQGGERGWHNSARAFQRWPIPVTAGSTQHWVFEQHLGKAPDLTEVVGGGGFHQKQDRSWHLRPATAGLWEADLAPSLAFFFSHLSHRKAPQEFSRSLAPSALSCEQSPDNLLNPQDESFAAAPVP